jgi:GNAT superfamily N-acetyltransferase
LSSMIEVKTVRDGFEDVFNVCSPNAGPGSKLMEGRRLRERWLRDTLNEHGPFTKVAYLDGKPVSQIMYYPEKALPYLVGARDGVVRIGCVYSRVPGKGAGSSLLADLVREAEDGIESLKGEQCRFLVTEPFATGEGLDLREFYTRNGFKEGDGELYLEIHGGYMPRERTEYTPLPEDEGRAVLFYNVNCEYSVSFADNVRNLIHEVKQGYPVDIVNMWTAPMESSRRGNELIIVNQRPIKSHWRAPEFRLEVQAAIENR